MKVHQRLLLEPYPGRAVLEDGVWYIARHLRLSPGWARAGFELRVKHYGRRDDCLDTQLF